MNTKSFLEMVLPSDGYCIIAVRTAKGFKHKGFVDREEAANFALSCDAQGLETYFACSAYKDKPHRDESGRFIARTSPNWHSAKAFWCDIDCGQDKAAEGKGYATQREGAKAILAWCQEKELPFPMLVNSGRGVHAYWCLTESLAPDRWYQTASALKTALDNDGILVDPSRTADFASVLRPVGTHNHKDEFNPKEVKLAFQPKELVDTEDFIAKVLNLGGIFEVPSWLKDEPVESIQSYPEVEAYAEVAADKCKAMAMMRDTQGDVSYDHWRGVIGVIKFCQEGVELAHKWSERRAETGHNNLDVDTRYNSWGSAPTTCEFFGKCCPNACQECKYRGEIKTPLVLGRKEPEQKAEEVEATIETEQGQQRVRMEIPEPPKGYSWDGNAMVRYVPDKNGVLQACAFCHTRFYLLERIRDEYGCFSFLVRAHLPNNVVREFMLDGGIIGVGGAKLLEKLGGFEILALNTKDAAMHMHAYIKDSVTKLTNDRDITSTFTHFGWQDGGCFLVGRRLYRPDGTIIECLLSGHASKGAQAFPRPRGSVEGYAKQINWLYNREGMEPMQYMICSLWAAPLVDFCEPTYNGIPCAMTGSRSGKGKTTAALAALYAFGEPFPNLCIAGKEGATAKAQSAFVGTLRNLPVLFDEVTNKSSAQLSDICYSLSNGVENMRMRSTGGRVEFGDRESWRTQVAMTGNAHICARLSENGNSEAEAMRLFEIRIDSYDTPELDPMAVSNALSVISQNTGAAGEAIIRFLVENRSEAQDILRDTYTLLHISPDLMKQPKYRFYRNHMACTLAMAQIAKKLGIADFNLERLITFAEDASKRLIEEAVEVSSLPPDAALAKMLTEFGPQILTTITFGKPSPTDMPYKYTGNKGLIGRAIRSNGRIKDDYDGKMYVSASAIRDWCGRNRVDMTEFSNKLLELGVLLSRNERQYLGKGTDTVSSQQRCWVFNLDKLETY